jgi:predicted acyl esterase
MEDPVQMLKQYPLMNNYWRDKRAEVSRIQVPAYVLASYSTFLHLPGSLRGFEELSHNNKWQVGTSHREFSELMGLTDHTG